jgi:hypothetical protein
MYLVKLKEGICYRELALEAYSFPDKVEDYVPPAKTSLHFDKEDGTPRTAPQAA